MSSSLVPSNRRKKHFLQKELSLIDTKNSQSELSAAEKFSKTIICVSFKQPGIENVLSGSKKRFKLLNLNDLIRLY